MPYILWQGTWAFDPPRGRPALPCLQEPILALRRQLASLSGAAAEAGECWLQLAQLCRGTGHYEAATTAVLEAVASRVPWAPLEHVQLLWDKGQPYRAVSEAQLLAQQAQGHALAAPFAKEADHSRFHAQVGPGVGTWGVGVWAGFVAACQGVLGTYLSTTRRRRRTCLPQVALQLAQWMAETGQAAKDEITGEAGWRGLLVSIHSACLQPPRPLQDRCKRRPPPAHPVPFPPLALPLAPAQPCLTAPRAWSPSRRRCCSAMLCTWMRWGHAALRCAVPAVLCCTHWPCWACCAWPLPGADRLSEITRGPRSTQPHLPTPPPPLHCRS